MNYQTEEKIKKLKESINEGLELKEIIKKYFKSQKQKDEWVLKYKEHFSENELEHLEITIENKVKNEDKTPNQHQIALKNFYTDIENMQLLKEIIADYKNRKEKCVILENGMLNLPLEVLQMKSDGTIGIKSNMAQYEEIKEIAFRNKISISTLVNYIFYEFLRGIK